jgi:hypothetical protein
LKIFVVENLIKMSTPVHECIIHICETYSNEIPGKMRRFNSPKGCKINPLLPRLVDSVEPEVVENALEDEIVLEEDKETLLENDLLVSVTRLK